MVAAYPLTADSPWPAGTAGLIDDSSALARRFSGGTRSGLGTARLLSDALQFNEVDVIGGPAANLPGSGRFLCRSTARPMFPYYVSLLDALAWRGAKVPDNQVEALTPGVREIGQWPAFTWGSVYPRVGFVVQAHAGKAAAVVSQRAIDIVLGDSQGHSVNRLATGTQFAVTRGDPNAPERDACKQSGGRWEELPRLNEAGRCVQQTWQQWRSAAHEKTDRWQMLTPHHSRQCTTFGSQRDWTHGDIAADGRYLWNYWTEYKCCVKTGGILLKEVDF